MRKWLLLAMVAVLVLAFALPAMADAPAKDNIKLRVFVHYPHPGKPAPRPGTCDPTSTSSNMYGLTGWKLAGPTTFRVNYGTIPATVTDAQTAIRASFAAWQQVSGISFSEGAATTVRGYKRDGQNVVVWGNVPSGAIAVTYTWANSVTGYAVEIDTVMGRSLPWKNNQVSSPDANCGDLYSYDVRNILIHEIGHWMGLDDLYESSEQDLTMYGYGDKGELKKITLESGDTLGIRAIY